MNLSADVEVQKETRELLFRAAKHAEDLGSCLADLTCLTQCQMATALIENMLDKALASHSNLQAMQKRKGC